MRRARENYPWKTIMKASLVIFLIFFSLYAALAFHYLHTLESFPNSATGAVYPLNIHGWVVYLDQARYRLLGALEAAEVVCAVVFAVARVATSCVRS
jgi:hypothetical protein